MRSEIRGGHVYGSETPFGLHQCTTVQLSCLSRVRGWQWLKDDDYWSMLRGKGSNHAKGNGGGGGGQSGGTRQERFRFAGQGMFFSDAPSLWRRGKGRGHRQGSGRSARFANRGPPKQRTLDLMSMPPPPPPSQPPCKCSGTAPSSPASDPPGMAAGRRGAPGGHFSRHLDPSAPADVVKEPLTLCVGIAAWHSAQGVKVRIGG